MDFIYTAATAPMGGRRGTADSRTNGGHSKQGILATASSWKVSANTPAMRAALCAVPCRVLLLTHPCWRVLMSEARRKQVGWRLVMGRCRLLWNCSTNQKAMGSAVGALISAKCWAQSSMPWVSTSAVMVSRIASSWVPSAARFRRAVARSWVMVGCWFGLEREAMVRGPRACRSFPGRRSRGRPSAHRRQS